MNEGRFETGNTPDRPDSSKTAYFSRLAVKHLPQLKFLFTEGRLTRRDATGAKLSSDSRENWSNVVEHSLTEAAIIDTLSDLLGFDEDEKRRLTRTAVLHDWDKRLSKQPNLWTTEDVRRATEELSKSGVDPILLASTSEDFLEKCLIKGEATFQEKLLAYADAISEGSEIMPFKERYEQAATRAHHYATDSTWKQRLEPILGTGANYWDGQIAMETRIQKEIFDALKLRGVSLESPDDLPRFVKSEIEKRYAHP